MPCKRSDLVVLIYADNNCYTSIVLADDPKIKKFRITIDEKKGTWWTASFDGGPARASQVRKLGECRYFPQGTRYGVIGVYDRTKLTHLNSMVDAAKEATKPSCSFGED